VARGAAGGALDVLQADVQRTRLVAVEIPALAPGQIRVRVDRLALTANTVTYAVVGHQLGYWQFFPLDGEWGLVPAMGWADVVESAHADIAVGGRYFGWWPTAAQAVIAATPIDVGVRDDGPHRAAHAPIYRRFLAAAALPHVRRGDDEDRHALLYGLFATGYLADDFLGESRYFGAARAVVVSASSKTGIVVAQRAAARGVEVIGLTSARNVTFVEQVGGCARVLPYERVDELPTDQDAVAIDMSGDGALLERVHARLGGRLRHSMRIGRTHHAAASVPVTTGPPPQFFFAPSQLGKTPGQREAIAAEFGEFVAASRAWLTLEVVRGGDAIRAAYADVAAGRARPDRGLIVSFAP
jgi:hypothetical protein